MNSDLIAFLTQCLSTLVMNLLIFLFLNKIYFAKFDNKFIYIVSYIISTVTFIIVNYIVSIVGVPVLNLMYTFLHVNLICKLLFKSTIKKSFLYNTLFIMILFFCDLLTVLIWTIIKGEALTEVLSNSQYLIVSCLINILVMFLGFRIYTAILSKHEINSIKFKEIILLVLLTGFEVFVAHSYALNAVTDFDRKNTIIILLGFLVLNVCVVYLIHTVSHSYKKQYEIKMIEQQNELQLAHYSEVLQRYEESRKIIHDIKKHLDVLNDLSKQNDYKAEQYGEIIKNKVESLLVGFQCTNKILSIIMSQKSSIADKENIKVETNIEDIPLNFMEDIHVTALFSNLWDNAIEACRSLAAEYREINIIMGKVEEYLVISFENSFDNIIINNVNGKLKSKKKKHEGLGLTIIEDIVKLYGGIMNYEWSDHVFKIEILIPIN